MKSVQKPELESGVGVVFILFLESESKFESNRFKGWSRCLESEPVGFGSRSRKE